VAELSPAAEAVLDAAYRRMDDNPHNEVEATLASAFTAAALYLEHDCQQLLAIAAELEADR
jgi:hypothetical protein